MAAATTVIPEGAIEHEGMLWKPRRGATASAEKFIAARTLFIELHDQAMWNPWIRDERAADLDAAAEVMGQWRRAEPGHRHLSLKQWEAQQTRGERKREQQRAKDEARRERAKARNDEERCTARLRLIEVQSSLDHGLTELAGFRDGTKVPAMDPKRRANEIRQLEQKVERLRAEVDRLTPIVGDPRTSSMSTAGCRVTGVSRPGGRTGWTVSAGSGTSNSGCPNWKPHSRPQAMAVSAVTAAPSWPRRPETSIV